MARTVDEAKNGSPVRTKNRDFHFPLKNAFPRLFFPFSGHKIPQL